MSDDVAGGRLHMRSIIVSSRTSTIAVSAAAGAFAFLHGHSAYAQTSAAPSNLPAITVQTTTPKAAKKKGSSSAAKSKANAPSAAAVPATSTTSPSTIETGTSPVQGFVAKVSGTGTKTDTPLVETPQAISVVTKDQAEQQGAQSVTQALLYTSGVAVDTRTAFSGYDIIYSRGFAIDRYLDGLRYPSGANYTSPQIELYGLERLEVLHGPASMLYGATSPGGLVNAISKRPTNEPYHEVELTFGNFDRLYAGFDFSGPVTADRSWSYRVTGLAGSVDSQVDFNEQERYWIAPALTWRPTAGTTLTFLANFQHDPEVGLYSQIPSVGTLDRSLGTIPRSRYLGEPGYNFNTRDQQSVGYAFEHRFDSTWTVRQNLRYMHTDGDVGQYLPLPAESGGGLFGDQLVRYRLTQTSDQHAFAVDTNAEAKFRTGALEHVLTFGVDHQRFGEKAYVDQSLGSLINIFNPVYGDYTPLFPFSITSDTDQTLNQTGIYVQDQIRLDRLIVTVGAREDFSRIETDDLLAPAFSSNQSDKAFTKRVGLTYLLGNGWAPYASYATSFQPTLGTDSAGRAFEPTTGEQYEVGIKYEPPGLRALFTVAAYDLKQQNVVTEDPLTFARIQLGEVHSRGIEVEGKLSITNELDVIGSYTYGDIEISKDLDPALVGRRPVNVPDQTAALWAFYTLHDGPLSGFGFGGGVRYVGDSAGSRLNNLTVPDYTIFDAAARYDLAHLSSKLEGMSVRLNALNVFDKTYVSQCSNEVTCIYGNGRTILTTLKYQW